MVSEVIDMQKNALADLPTGAFIPAIVMSMPLAAQTTNRDANGLAPGKKIFECGCGNKNRIQPEAGKGAGFFFATPA